MRGKAKSHVTAGSTPFQGGSNDPGPSRERLDGPAALSSIYVASSWRNPIQPAVVSSLRAAGFECYDFRHPHDDNEGFHWSYVYGRPGDAAEWTDGVLSSEMIRGLAHPRAVAGFVLDMAAMERCDTCVLVLPCGRSAHLELGWFVGQGRRTAILLDNPCQPELMYRMVDHLATELPELVTWLASSH